MRTVLLVCAFEGMLVVEVLVSLFYPCNLPSIDEKNVLKLASLVCLTMSGTPPYCSRDRTLQVSFWVPYSKDTHTIQSEFGYSKNFETYQNGERSKILNRVPIMPIMCI